MSKNESAPRAWAWDIIEEVQQVLAEDGAPAGTVHTWGDGSKHVKTKGGEWVPVPKGQSPKAVAQGGGSPAPAKHAPPKPGAAKPPEKKVDDGQEKSKADAKPAGPEVDPGVKAGYLKPDVKPQPGPWKESLPNLPKDTSDVYLEKPDPHDDSTWKVKDPERQKLYDKILKGYSEHVPDYKALGQSKPMAVLMMGGPASGKSSANRGLDKNKFVVVDPDGVKMQLPEYREGVKERAKNAAALAHEESSFVSKQIRGHAIENSKNVLVDGTGKNLKSYMALIKQLKEKGYHVSLMMPDVDEEIGRTRGKARAEKTGRYVPDGSVQGEPDFYKDAYSKIPKNFGPLSKLVDEFHMFDTRGNPAKHVWSKTIDPATGEAKEEQHDPEFVKNFKAKHGGFDESVWYSHLIPLDESTRKLYFEDGEGVTDVKKKDSAGKSAKLPSKEVVDGFLKGYEAQAKELEAQPKQFKFGEGIRMIPSDAAAE